MNHFKFSMTVLAGALAISACSNTPSPQVDSHFGEASAMLRAMQVYDPAAPLRNEGRAVAGLEGPAASHAVDQYYKTFNKPPPPMTILNIGVPGGTGR